MNIPAQGRKPDAYRRLDAAIAERPHRIEARVAKARLLLQDGDARAAAAEARNALQRDSNSAAAHDVAALAAMKSGNTAEAEREFEAVTRIDRPFRSQARKCCCTRSTRIGGSGIRPAPSSHCFDKSFDCPSSID